MGTAVPYTVGGLLSGAGTGRFEPMILGEAERFSDKALNTIRGALPSWSGGLCILYFNIMMQDWLARHFGAVNKDKHQPKRKLRNDARRGQRAALDGMIAGLEKTKNSAQNLSNYQPGPDRLVDELAPEHYLPSESALNSGQYDRAREELRAIYRGIERLLEAADQARDKLSKSTGRPREAERLVALVDLAAIYTAASGKIPGDSNNGPWAKFAQAVKGQAWPNSGPISEYIRQAARTVRRRREAAREIMGAKGLTIQNSRFPPLLVPYHRRLSPSSGEGT